MRGEVGCSMQVAGIDERFVVLLTDEFMVCFVLRLKYFLEIRRFCRSEVGMLD